MTTQHNTQKASNHRVNRSSYIHQGTYQLGFSISSLMSALPRDDLNEKGMNPFKCLKAKKKQTRGNLK
jgi:hypothetical protein